MSKNFEDLVELMRRLRAPGGCPWDREQTFASLAPYLLEETYETYDAIQEAAEGAGTANLREELGDLLLQIVFHSQVAEEMREFTIYDVVDTIHTKMVLRHPHVFADRDLKTAEDVLHNWDDLKKNERAASGKLEKKKESLLDDVPIAFPGLMEANKLTKKAAKVGFDWETAEPVFDKIQEEIEELRREIKGQNAQNLEEEIGDLLFAVVNLARKLEVEPESALKRTNRKFRRRFKFIEEKLKTNGKTLEESDLEEMDALWNEAKRTTDNE